MDGHVIYRHFNFTDIWVNTQVKRLFDSLLRKMLFTQVLWFHVKTVFTSRCQTGTILNITLNLFSLGRGLAILFAICKADLLYPITNA